MGKTYNFLAAERKGRLSHRSYGCNNEFTLQVAVYWEDEFYAEDKWLVDDKWTFATLDEARGTKC